MFEIGLSHYLVLSAALFCIGAYGALARRNAVGVLMCFELMLNAVNINLVAFSRYVAQAVDPNLFAGHVFAALVITVAAAETSIGLALIINIYRNRDRINVDEIDLMKW